jgi:hypothetical protein
MNLAEVQAKIAQVAVAQRGKPYVYGSNGPYSFDCKGLTRYCFGQAGGDLNTPQWAEGSIDQYELAPESIKVPAGESLQLGDFAYFKGSEGVPRLGHCGVVIDAITMVDAPYTGAVVRYDSYSRFTTEGPLTYDGAIRPALLIATPAPASDPPKPNTEGDDDMFMAHLKGSSDPHYLVSAGPLCRQTITSAQYSALLACGVRQVEVEGVDLNPIPLYDEVVASGPVSTLTGTGADVLKPAAVNYPATTPVVVAPVVVSPADAAVTAAKKAYDEALAAAAKITPEGSAPISTVTPVVPTPVDRAGLSTAQAAALASAGPDPL